MLQGNRVLANQNFAYIFAVQPYIHTFVDDRARRLLSPLRLGERCAKVGDLAGLSAPSACNILQRQQLLRDKHGIQSSGGPAIISSHQKQNTTLPCAASAPLVGENGINQRCRCLRGQQEKAAQPAAASSQQCTRCSSHRETTLPVHCPQRHRQ